MDIQDDEILELWRALEKHKVRYIMIGGFAMNFHGYTLVYEDINLYIDDTFENRSRLGEALEFLKISTREIIERMQFVPGWSIINLMNGFPLDMMTKVKGLEYMSFDECFQMALSAKIEDVTVKFLHLNHLLESKRAANRPKDQIDVLALEEIKKEREQRGEI